MRISKNAITLTSFVILLAMASCGKEEKDPPTPEKGQFELVFAHTYDEEPFLLNTNYTNEARETLRFSKVRYYISNIKLKRTDGTEWAEENSYHLVDADDGSSTVVKLENVPEGSYDRLTYMIGVDSARNVSGAQTGALDPANDMFWSWNTGYIFIKIEGRSPAATNDIFVYHIGGFQGQNNALEVNEHLFQEQKLNISADNSPQVHLQADLKNLFDGLEHELSIAGLSSNIQSPGPEAQKLAANFRTALSLDQIQE